MKSERRRYHLARAGLLELLSDEEIASVSTAETADHLMDGDEYVDLEHLEHGVRRARARAAMPPMGRVLPRKAVLESTWTKIVAQLAALERAKLN
jgi:hypothetical protein